MLFRSVKRSRKMNMDIKENSADWEPQFEIIKGVIEEPFVQRYIDFFDTQTMAARLQNKESMSSEFKKRMAPGSFLDVYKRQEFCNAGTDEDAGIWKS